MKLLNLASFLSEATVEDDPFAPERALSVGPGLIQRLEHQERSIARQLDHTKSGLYNMLDNSKHCWNIHSYPGGSLQAGQDVIDKKLILLIVDKDWGRGKRRRGKLIYSNKRQYVIP